MNFFNKLVSLFSPSSADNRNLWIYVKCKKCGEILRGRVDLHNELSIRYGESGGETSYYCRKVFVGGNRCYQPIEVELTFDKNRRLINEDIKGGVFVSEEDFLKANPEAQG
jgi:hypothetical protein